MKADRHSQALYRAWRTLTNRLRVFAPLSRLHGEATIQITRSNGPWVLAQEV